MKKLLLSCFLALGIGANAQFVQTFDAGTTLPTGWSVINGGDPNGFIVGAVPSGGTVTAAQSGSNVARIAYNAAAHDDYLVTPAITVQAGVNDRISFYVASFSSTYTENYDVRVSTGNTAAAFAAGTVVKATSKAPAAWTKYTIDLTPYVGTTIYVGFHATDTDMWYLMFDTIVNDTVPTTVPSCATNVSPAAGATNVSVRPAFTWNDAVGATGYKLYLGTTPGGNELANGVAASSGSLILSNNPPLTANTTYYLKIVPNNDIGDATGCVETSFTTGANFYTPYCGPFNSSTPTQIAPITSVKLATTAYTSDTAATTVGTYPTGENFISSIFEIFNTVTSIPFEVKGVGITNNGWAASVFIDWNNDGDFLDAGESYFNTTATMLRSTTVTGGIVTLTGNLVVPTGVTLGDKRVRVKYNFSGTTINSPLTTACTDLTNGQVEDYTLRVKDAALGVSMLKKEDLTVYPNPFADMLNISDVKEVKSISVSDVSGRKVRTLAPASQINLSSLKSGLYIVTLHMNDGTVKSVKAIKK